MSDLQTQFPAGVISGQALTDLFALAKANQFALPAVNCIGSNSMNTVMETAGRLQSPVIIQFSTSGSAFVGGKAVPVSGDEASILGSVAGARHVQTMAAAYDARVVLHTDHCPKKKLGWISGLIDVGEEHFAETGRPLFSSHMLDLSEDPMEENIDTCVEFFRRMAPMGMTLEIELGITGGEEDGVDNTGADEADLYSKPEEVAYAYERLSEVAPSFTIAAAFGNVHGVYKPGNVKLTPTILRDAQAYVEEKFSTGPKPVDFVFHGGSGSTPEEISEAISYGVVKMNIDTDLQWAFWDGVRGYEAEHHDYLQGQLGNPTGPDAPNKKQYDPRAWLRAGEVSGGERLERCFAELNNVGTLTS
ncbi:MAG: class II fructose-bisphosphate aldolase [Ilumatobacteraceae bacterium]